MKSPYGWVILAGYPSFFHLPAHPFVEKLPEAFVYIDPIARKEPLGF